MTDDDRIDEIIRNLSADYNRPPSTPGDEMWTRIEAARQGMSAGPRLHVAAGGASAAPFGGYSKQNRFGNRYAWFGMAAAAVLLVATGVSIGRWTNKPSGGALTGSGVTVVAETPSDAPVPSDGTVSAPVPAASSSEAGEPAGSRSTQAPRRTHDEIVRNPRIVGQRTLRPLPGSSRFASTQPAAGNSQIYQVATLRHLADAEALLTSFSLGNHDAGMDANFSVWAKGLLSNTRLLLDSPAGDDPRRAKLLQDLEQVLAQIVQLSPSAAATDRELIQGSIQEGHVITRLRTAIPAGQPREILER